MIAPKHLRADSTGQKLAYVYFGGWPGRRSTAKLLTRDEARRIAANVAGAKTSPIMRVICRPTIAMRNFVPAVSINRRLTVVRYDNIAGVVTLPGASYREEIKTHRHANRAHFGLRHNALDDVTIIRMVVLRGRFELGRGACRACGNGNA